jgi:hypothetical protein
LIGYSTLVALDLQPKSIYVEGRNDKFPSDHLKGMASKYNLLHKAVYGDFPMHFVIILVHAILEAA